MSVKKYLWLKKYIFTNYDQMELLATFFPKNCKPDVILSLAEDKQWYRAKVLAYPSEERVCVGYLDFGNSEEVELNHLQPISPSLLELPMQAIPCALAGSPTAVHELQQSVMIILFRFGFNIRLFIYF